MKFMELRRKGKIEEKFQHFQILQISHNESENKVIFSIAESFESGEIQSSSSE